MSLFDAFSYPWPPSSTFDTLRDIERPSRTTLCSLELIIPIATSATMSGAWYAHGEKRAHTVPRPPPAASHGSPDTTPPVRRASRGAAPTRRGRLRRRGGGRPPRGLRPAVPRSPRTYPHGDRRRGRRASQFRQRIRSSRPPERAMV